MVARAERTILSVLGLSLVAACGGGGGGGGGPDVDAQISTVVAQAPFGTEADGTSVTVTVTLFDDQGQPLANKSVTLTVAGVGGSVVQPATRTNASGVTTGTVSTLVAGTQTVSAAVGSVTLDDTADVTFIRNPPDARYVRASGSDTNGGTSPLDAWATLVHALTQVQPGQTLFVGAGTYAGGLVLGTSGSAGAPIELRGDPAGLYAGDAGAVVVDAAQGAFGLHLDGVAHVVVRGFTFVEARPGLAQGGGLFVDGGSDVYLLDNDLYANDRGIDVQGAQRVHVEGNRVSQNGGGVGEGDGIRLDQTSGVTLENDLVYANGRYGLFLVDSAATTTVRHSTFYLNADDQVHEEGAGGSGSIRDTLVTDGLATGIALVSGTGFNETFNLVWNNAPDVVVGPMVPPPSGSDDPEFVSPAGTDALLGGAQAADDDFRLATTSPGVDAGSLAANRTRLFFGGALRGTTTRVDGTLDGEGADGSQSNLGVHRPASTDAFVALQSGEARLLHVSGDDVRARSRVRSGGTWAATRRAAPLNEDVRWIVHEVSPTSSAEEFLAALSDEGNGTTLYLRRFDGRLWSEDHPLHAPQSVIPSANAGQRGFDLALEQSSGEALFVYADDDASPLYRTFSNGRWSDDQEVYAALPSAGTVLWVELVARPGTDEIALVTLDDTETLSALVWDGDAWTDMGAPMMLDTQSAELRESKAFDAAFEGLSGDLLVGWGHTTVVDETRYMQRDGTTGVWSAQTQHNSTGACGAVYRLAADPTSDRIAAAIGEGTHGVDVSGMIWGGDSWVDVAGELVTNVPFADPTYGVVDQFDLSVGWLGTTGRAVVVLDRNGAQGTLRWANWNPAANPGLGWNNLIYTPTPVPVSGMGTMAFAELRSVPGTNLLEALVVDDAGALFALRYNGSQWTLEGGGPLATDLPASGAAEPFALSFRP